MDDIVVTKHGDSYDAEFELYQKYPCLPCAECGSLDVNIKDVQQLRAKQSGIYEYDRFRISYECTECGCNFRYDYTDEFSKRPAEISKSIFVGVISFLIGTLSIFSAVCAIQCDLETASGIQYLSLLLWDVLSYVIAGIAVCTLFDCLLE